MKNTIFLLLLVTTQTQAMEQSQTKINFTREIIKSYSLKLKKNNSQSKNPSLFKDTWESLLKPQKQNVYVKFETVYKAEKKLLEASSIENPHISLIQKIFLKIHELVTHSTTLRLDNCTIATPPITSKDGVYCSTICITCMSHKDFLKLIEKIEKQETLTEQ